MAQFQTDNPSGQYFLIAGGQTTATIGAVGAAGDYLESITFSAGATPTATTLFDGATAVLVFTPTTLTATSYRIGAYSKSGKWNVTTGTNVTAFAVGKFS